jgi:CTP synthase
MSKEKKKINKPKFIFVSGGVLSGLGKGLCAASLGMLLKSHGYKVTALKCENYLNVDAGTMNPIEHGDTFLCQDGLEADMDLGTYERVLGEPMGYKNFITKGKIFKDLIEKERSMYFKGETVEDIPHVVNYIVSKIKDTAVGYDFCIIEIGGTVGEYQNVLYYEAARHMRVKYNNTIDVHVSYLPIPNHLGEPKTKPTQMSVRTLMGMGINPEFLVLRSRANLDTRRRKILGDKAGVKGENVIMAKDLDNIYELPLSFAEQGFDKKVLSHFGLKPKRLNLTKWKNFVSNYSSKKKKKVTIALAGKYFSKNDGDFELIDAYHALLEAISHASASEQIEVKMHYINTNKYDYKSITDELEDVDAIIVPIGWGERGVEGKIQAIKYARENKVPYLGLCYGMQLACVEYARDVIKIKDAHTEEVKPKTKNKIIHSIPFDKKYQVIKGKGVSMRLGGYDCVLKKDTLAYSIYEKHNAFKDKKTNTINERHRHRFEFNNDYRKQFEDAGFIFSGTSPDNFFVEFIELPKKVHPFFIATQAHPEYKSTPLNPHPVFVEFLKAGEANKKARK